MAGPRRAQGNVISANEETGVSLDVDSIDNTLQGNYIGTDASGSAALGNGQRGVEITTSADNTIGGTATGAGNVISGNSWSGLVLESGTFGTVVQQNRIGTDVTGTQALPNVADGIVLDASNNNTVGGTANHAGNLISGNGSSGICIRNGSFENVVQGNELGTDVNGTAALGNEERGIVIDGAWNNEIGGTAEGSGNLISGNAWSGVMVTDYAMDNSIQGNLIGTDKTGTLALGNGALGGAHRRVVGQPHRGHRPRRCERPFGERQGRRHDRRGLLRKHRRRQLHRYG